MEYQIQKLVQYAKGEEFDLFAEALHTDLHQGHLRLCHIGALLEQLQYALYNQSDEDEEDVEYTYLALGTCLHCCAYFVFAELKKLIWDGMIKREGNILTRGNETLDLSVLGHILDQIAEKDPEVISLKQYVSGLDTPQNMLQWRILDKFTPENAALLMHVLYYLRDISSVRELQRRQRLLVENFSKEALIEEHAKILHSVYCYLFLEQCSQKELERTLAARQRYMRAETSRELILALAEKELWLGKWLNNSALMPFTVYSLLAEDSGTPVPYNQFGELAEEETIDLTADQIFTQYRAAFEDLAK